MRMATARKRKDHRDEAWYAAVAEVLDAAPSWPEAAAQLGMTASACRSLAVRLARRGVPIRSKGLGGRPSAKERDA